MTAQPYAFAANDDGTLDVHTNMGFVSGGTATNYSSVINISQPNPLTSVLFNTNIQTAAKNYTNTTYGTSYIAADVILLGGVTSV